MTSNTWRCVGFAFSFGRKCATRRATWVRDALDNPEAVCTVSVSLVKVPKGPFPQTDSTPHTHQVRYRTEGSLEEPRGHVRAFGRRDETTWPPPRGFRILFCAKGQHPDTVLAERVDFRPETPDHRILVSPGKPQTFTVTEFGAVYQMPVMSPPTRFSRFKSAPHRSQAH